MYLIVFIKKIGKKQSTTSLGNGTRGYYTWTTVKYFYWKKNSSGGSTWVHGQSFDVFKDNLIMHIAYTFIIYLNTFSYYFA